MPVINQAGLDLIKSFEGCRLAAYQDSGGVWTIGWGHTGPDVYEGLTITQQQADSTLEADLAVFEKAVNGMVTHDATPNQFAALVSFAYNLGAGALRDSTLLQDFNLGNIEGAAGQFGLWVYDDGVVLEGLVRRRAAEKALFLTP